MDEDTEKEAQYNHNVGISAGLRRAGQYLMSVATQKFEKGDDFSATMIREFATLFLNQSQTEHPGPPE